MNPTHTPPTSLRIPKDVKEAAQKRAAAENKTLTDVVVAYLRWYGDVPAVTLPPSEQ